MKITPILKFFGNLFKDPRKQIKLAVQLTQWLKKAIDSGVSSAIVDATPTDKDNKWRDKQSKRLATVLKFFGLIDNLTYISEKTIIELKGPNRRKWLTAIAAELASRDLDIDYDSAEAQTQLIYEVDPEFRK